VKVRILKNPEHKIEDSFGVEIQNNCRRLSFRSPFVPRRFGSHQLSLSDKKLHQCGLISIHLDHKVIQHNIMLARSER
jgi:hypothetical protein